MYKKTVLNNGLKIISHSMPSRESVALGIWINVGGRYENSGNKGISHFLEHLLFKGTKKYSCRKLKESIEGIGGSLNGFTSEEATCYLVKVPAVHINTGLGILSDMVINPTLPSAEIEKEKTVILEELKMYRDLPQSYVYELLDELLWPDQPLGEPIIGTVESVNNIGRKQLSDFRQKHYTASNIVVSACGNLDYGKLEHAVKKIFSGFKRKKSNIFLAVREAQEKPGLKVLLKDTEQTHMALGFKSFKRDHPLKHAQGLLHVILGANMSSRLFNELRERRGLAYEIGTVIKRFQDTGAFVVHAGIDNKKVFESIKLILNELNKIKASIVTDAELKRAKEFYIGQLKLALEDTLEYMLWIGESTLLADKTFSLGEIISEVNSVDKAAIRKTARKIFNAKNINLSLIGPLKGMEEKIRLSLCQIK
ncbi:MAG: pitrilysin family protein, partial [Candidatus Omnitrophica bacterium]|nr:pitrilysin family protein [Candidatus Omnitrophota bacterium]